MLCLGAWFADEVGVGVVVVVWLGVVLWLGVVVCLGSWFAAEAHVVLWGVVWSWFLSMEWGCGLPEVVLCC